MFILVEYLQLILDLRTSYLDQHQIFKNYIAVFDVLYFITDSVLRIYDIKPFATIIVYLFGIFLCIISEENFVCHVSDTVDIDTFFDKDLLARNVGMT